MDNKLASEMTRALVELLKPACQTDYCREAGSVRRMKPQPNDLEIVCMPIITPIVQLSFMGSGITMDPANRPGQNALDVLCNVLLSQGRLEMRPNKAGKFAWGSRLKRAIYYHTRTLHAPLDLFAVIPPATWGAIYAIRTGPAVFNRLLVTSQRHGGACPLDRKVAGGRVWPLDCFIPDLRTVLSAMPAVDFLKEMPMWVKPLDTATEAQFFAALGVPCWPAHLRTVQKLKEYLR